MKRQHWWHEHADQHYASVREAPASRWKRLAPSWCQDASTRAQVPAVDIAAGTIQPKARCGRSKVQASVSGYASVRESSASRWKRLAPSWCQDAITHAQVPAVDMAAETIQPNARGCRSKVQASVSGTAAYALQRPDEKIVRHARRGTTVEAMTAL